MNAEEYFELGRQHGELMKRETVLRECMVVLQQVNEKKIQFFTDTVFPEHSNLFEKMSKETHTIFEGSINKKLKILKEMLAEIMMAQMNIMEKINVENVHRRLTGNDRGVKIQATPKNSGPL